MRGLELPVTTERLRIRAFQESDRNFEVMLSEHPALFVNLPVGPRSPTEIDQYVEARLGFECFDDVGQTCALMVETGDGDYVGSMQLTAFVLEPLQLQIGWIALPKHQGKGFMTEAVARVVSLAFQSVAAHRIVAEILSGNDASERLAERVGFRKEAHFVRSAFVKGQWRDEFVYALLEDDADRGLSAAT